MKLFPLSTTYPDWQSFIKVVQEEFGYSPTRGLDGSIISPKDLSAFLSCLNLENNPVNSLRNRNAYFWHVHMSIGMITDEFEIIIKVGRLSNLKLTTSKIEKKYFTVITGNIAEVIDSIESLCQDKETKEVSNFLYNLLVQSGYRECFDGYDKSQTRSGDIILRRK